jgi:prepilin-type N-terminal cleavage/methylation domain-containing protein
MNVITAMIVGLQAVRSIALHDRTSFSKDCKDATSLKEVNPRRSQESNAMLTMNYLTSGFTLIELIVVLAVIGILATISCFAFQGLLRSNQFSRNVYQLADEIKLARSYAVSNDTYVYLGLEETDRPQDSGATPQIAGTGRVDIGLVATKGGTAFDSTNYKSSDLVLIRPVTSLDLIHIAASLPAATSGGMARPSNNVTNINSSAALFSTAFSLPLGSNQGAGKYNFACSIPFNPQGAITANGSAVQYIEIDLVPCVGGAVPSDPTSSNQSNQAALIIDGATGAITVFRP